MVDGTRAILSRLKIGLQGDAVWSHSIRQFDQAVAAALTSDLNAIWGYEFCCDAMFERARALGIPRIFDAVASHHSFYDAIERVEAEKFPELLPAPKDEALVAERIRLKERELVSADLVMANSRFTAQ